MNEYLINSVIPGRAVMRLRPNAEWSMSNNDISTLIWHTEGVEPITQQEFDDMIEVIKAELLSGQ